MAWLSNKQLIEMGFASIGGNPQLSDRAAFHNCANICLGDNVRIDDFCVLSAGCGGITVGCHVHIAVYSSLIGAGHIGLADYCNISSRVAIYSSNDDYSGSYMTNPTVPAEFTRVQHEAVSVGRHAIVGAGSVVLPGVTLEEGVAIGALSLVNVSCSAFGIYAGVPVRRIGERKMDLLQLEKQLIAQKTSQLMLSPSHEQSVE